jgi:hypothetical protein
MIDAQDQRLISRDELLLYEHEIRKALRVSEVLCVGHNMRSRYAWEAPQTTERTGLRAGAI